ncbi:MAG: NAD(P)/FAD-dependent oxidoreductase [Candidatus Omnitrophota bacterium]
MVPDVAIIGGGPAGIAAAVQLKRFDFQPLLFEKKQTGGLLWNAHWVENYPGFPDGISGPSLATELTRHLHSHAIHVFNDEIITADYHRTTRKFSLMTRNRSYTSDILIIASGTQPLTDGILSLTPAELQKCVAFEMHDLRDRTNGEKKKKIVIIGAGDIAFDYALQLSESPDNDIVIVFRSETINALPLLVRRVKERPTIRLESASILQTVRQGNHHALAVTFRKGEGFFTLEADVLVGAIGRTPQRDFYSPSLSDIEPELISEGRLYLAGDVKNGLFRQAVIAAGNGVETAMNIYRNDQRMMRGYE